MRRGSILAERIDRSAGWNTLLPTAAIITSGNSIQ